MSKRQIKTILFLLVICAVIAIAPLIFITDSKFGGADGSAQEAITAIAPNYQPWANSIMKPPGGETESLLFCLQAALGAGVFGYGLGIYKERNRKSKGEETLAHEPN